jgi:hypothetical protein
MTQNKQDFHGSGMFGRAKQEEEWGDCQIQGECEVVGKLTFPMVKSRIISG